jgi:hypothetical protein
MDRFSCKGNLQVKVSNSVDDDSTLIQIKLNHLKPHIPYCDISLDDDIKAIIHEMAHLQAGKVPYTPVPSVCILFTQSGQIWEHILKTSPEKAKNITEKQIHFAWIVKNEENWRLDDDQVKSASKLLRKLEEEGHDVEIIKVPAEPGRHSIAFALRDVLKNYGGEVYELAMDSTCKY